MFPVPVRSEEGDSGKLYLIEGLDPQEGVVVDSEGQAEKAIEVESEKTLTSRLVHALK